MGAEVHGALLSYVSRVSRSNNLHHVITVYVIAQNARNV